MKSRENVISVSFFSWACACPDSPVAPPSTSQAEQRNAAITFFISVSSRVAFAANFIARIVPLRLPVHRREPVFEHGASEIRRSIGDQIEQRRNDSFRIADPDRVTVLLAFRLRAHIHENGCSA